MALSQRAVKGQPFGGSIRLGGDPEIENKRVPPTLFTSGIDFFSPTVYWWAVS